MSGVNQLHAVGQLIDHAKRMNPRWDTDELLAKRATDTGWPVSKQYISKLRREPIKSVNADQVRMLAAATGEPIDVVLRAFLEAMGLPTGREPRGDAVAEAIAADGRLSSEDRDTLLTLVRAMRRRGAVGDH